MELTAAPPATTSTPFQEGMSCPSARPDWEGAQVIGVVGGTVDEPRVSYLRRPLPVVPELLALTAPVRPTEVLRFAAPCAEHACPHFRAGSCHLVEKAITLLSPVVDNLPQCHVRGHRRWFLQEGKEVCFRCPQVVTDGPLLDTRLSPLADPTA